MNCAVAVNGQDAILRLTALEAFAELNKHRNRLIYTISRRGPNLGETKKSSQQDAAVKCSETQNVLPFRNDHDRDFKAAMIQYNNPQPHL